MNPILFLATTRSDQSRKFYEETMQFECVSDSPYAMVFDLGITMMRIQKVESMPTVEHTVLGWTVSNIESTIRVLANRGVVFKRFPALSQDSLGIWTTPDSAKIAWFSDPDGNVLSLTEHPA